MKLPLHSRPTFLVSSTARRALETAELAVAGSDNAGKIRAEPRLYEAEADGKNADDVVKLLFDSVEVP